MGKSSVLKPFVWPMKVARFFGFPIKCVDHLGYEFGPNKHMWLFCFLIQSIWFVLIMVAFLQLNSQSASSIIDFSTTLGLTWFDMFIDCITFTILISNILMGCHLLREKHHEFGLLVESCNNLDPQIKPDLGHMVGSLKRRHWWLTLPILLGAFLSTFGNLKFFQALLRSNGSVALYTLLGLGNLVTLQPIVPLLLACLVKYFMTFLTKSFHKFRIGIKSQELSELEVIDYGLHLHQMLMTMEQVFGRMILFDLLLTSISTVSTLFFGICTGVLLIQTSINWAFAWLSLNLTGVCGPQVIRIVTYLHAGQRLTEAMHGCRSEIKERFANKQLELPDNEKFRLSLLLERIGVSAAIRPMDIFDMTFSFGMSLLGMILTYLIILLQFRLL